MVESTFLELKNRIYAFCQQKSQRFVENSLILSHIDDFIMLFMTATIVGSTFLPSEKIGLLAIGAILLTFLKLFTKKGAAVRIAPWDCALVVYFAICLISTFNSELLTQSVHGFLKTVIYIFYYFCALNYFQTNSKKIKYFFLLIGLMCAFQSVIAIIQNLGGVEQISTWQDSNYLNPEDAISRAYGTLLPFNPNLLGGYLVAGLPCIIAGGMIFLLKKNYKRFVVNLLAFFVCAVAVFLTGSRGAYLGLGATIFAFILLFSKIIYTDFLDFEKVKYYWKWFVGGVLSFIALVFVCTPQILKRLLSIFILRGDSSTSFRMNVYNSSWHMFLDNWILGIGTGNQTFREIYGLYMLTGFDALSTYSVPLEIAVEAGVFALIAYIAFIGLFLYYSFKFISEKVSLDVVVKKVVVSASILTIVGVMTHGLFDTIYFRPQVQFLFWTTIAMSSSVFFKNNCEQKE